MGTSLVKQGWEFGASQTAAMAGRGGCIADRGATCRATWSGKNQTVEIRKSVLKSVAELGEGLSWASDALRNISMP